MLTEIYVVNRRLCNLKGRKRDGRHYSFLCINCGEVKTYNEIMNGSMCVDSPSHRHTCGPQEKHKQRTEALNLHAVWRMLIRIIVNILNNIRRKSQACFAAVFEEAEVSAKQY